MHTRIFKTMKEKLTRKKTEQQNEEARRILDDMVTYSTTHSVLHTQELTNLAEDEPENSSEEASPDWLEISYKY